MHPITEFTTRMYTDLDFNRPLLKLTLYNPQIVAGIRVYIETLFG